VYCNDLVLSVTYCVWYFAGSSESREGR